jgi:hypothetical protein
VILGRRPYGCQVRRLLVPCVVVLALAGCTTDDGATTEPTTPASSSAVPPEPTATTMPNNGDPVPEGPTYVALGDSYTSAPGVPETERESGCSRSNANYPSLVAAELDLPLVDVSCSGADTLALVGTQDTEAGPVAPQFLALTPDAEVVTLGMGGNDEGLFRELVSVCLGVAEQDRTGAPCRDAMASPGGDTALKRIEVIRERLVSALAGIQGASPDAAVVLVGYPQLIPPSGTCDELPLADGDYAYVRDLTIELGKATKSAAAEAGVGYADVLKASEGHDICAGDEAWVNGVLPNKEAAPLHPFAVEQAAVADLVLAALKNAGTAT